MKPNADLRSPTQLPGIFLMRNVACVEPTAPSFSIDPSCIWPSISRAFHTSENSTREWPNVIRMSDDSIHVSILRCAEKAPVVVPTFLPLSSFWTIGCSRCFSLK